MLRHVDGNKSLSKQTKTLDLRKVSPEDVGAQGFGQLDPEGQSQRLFGGRFDQKNCECTFIHQLSQLRSYEIPP